MNSLKRTQSVPTRLLEDIYDYPAPSDLDELIDLSPVNSRKDTLEWVRVMEADFDRRKSTNANLVAVVSDSGQDSLRVSIDPPNDVQAVISSLDSLTAGGTVSAFGDATNLAANSDFYVKGNAAVGFDAAGAGTTCGLTQAMSTALDLTDYVNVGQAFVWIDLSTVTGLTSVALRIGSDSSNYYLITATTDHNGNAFKAGWNLVSFSLSAKSTVGTPTVTATDYWACYLNKTAVAQTGFVMDNLIIARGDQFSVAYYSDMAWQTAAGTWILNSTADTDILNAGEGEYDLILKKCAEDMSGLVKDYDDMAIYAKQYKDTKERYQMENPDVSLIIEAESHRWESVSG